MAYPLGQLRSEVVFIAYHLHWSHDEIMEFTHRERVEWVREISAINKRVMSSE